LDFVKEHPALFSGAEKAEPLKPINKIYWRIGVSCVDNKIAKSESFFTTQSHPAIDSYGIAVSQPEERNE
jgi:hypothetical protein